MHDGTGGGCISEAIILPEIPEHFNKVGFATAKETADPNSLLLLAPKTIEIGSENPFEPARVLPIADERVQLEAEGFDLALVVADLSDLRYAIIEQLNRRGITEVKFAVDHWLRKPSVEVMGTAMKLNPSRASIKR